MNKNKLNILPCRDIYDKQIVNKGDLIPNLPFRLGVIGKSALSGKSTVIANLVAREEFYGKDFNGDNIFIISKSIEIDDKIKNIVKFKKIPADNLIHGFNEDLLHGIVDIIKERYEEEMEENGKASHTLMIFDDMSFNMDLRNDRGVLGEIVCNLRHYLVSSIWSAQRITQLAPTIRANLSACIIFKQTQKDIDIVLEDFNYGLTKKEFIKMFNDATASKHDFLLVNLDNPPENLYMKGFNPIDLSKYNK